MLRPHRRAFLGSSLAGLAALSAGHAPTLLPARDLAAPVAPEVPDGLFLTWQRDPTTTMTVQWVGPDTRRDTVLSFAPVTTSGAWQVVGAAAKPFPGTGL